MNSFNKRHHGYHPTPATSGSESTGMPWHIMSISSLKFNNSVPRFLVKALPLRFHREAQVWDTAESEDVEPSLRPWPSAQHVGFLKPVQGATAPTFKKKNTSLRVIPTVTFYWNIFVTNSDILSALRSLDFIRIILSSSSLLLARGPAVTTVIYQAKLIQTDSRYAWFKIISDARASRDA